MGNTDEWGRKQYILAAIGLIVAIVTLIVNIYGIPTQEGTITNSVINSGNGNVDYSPKNTNINTDTIIMNKDSDGQLSKHTAFEVLSPGNIFRGTCTTNGKILDIELQINDVVGSEVPKFSGDLRRPLTSENNEVSGYFEPSTNKICFTEYSYSKKAEIGEYSLEITSNGLNGNVVWLGDEVGKGTVSLYTWKDYSDL